jgi:hypothetical protein
MKLLELVWRDPTGSVISEKLDASVFKVEMGQGWVTLKHKDNGIVRYIPSGKVELIQFNEMPDESRILSPSPAPFPRVPS